MDTAHAAAVAISIGRSGAWVGPLVVGLAAGALDYSAAGPGRLRDRVAVAGYFASAAAFAELTGWSSWIRSTCSSYDWRMIGGLANLAILGGLLIVCVGYPRQLAAALGGKVGFGTKSGAKGGAAPAGMRINQHLLGWAVAAAMTSPLAGNSTWGTAVSAITQWTTGAWSALAGALMRQIGV